MSIIMANAIHYKCFFTGLEINFSNVKILNRTYKKNPFMQNGGSGEHYAQPPPSERGRGIMRSMVKGAL